VWLDGGRGINDLNDPDPDRAKRMHQHQHQRTRFGDSTTHHGVHAPHARCRGALKKKKNESDVYLADDKKK
jgi:hypothetical protein